MTDTDVLIGRALANALGRPLRATSIRLVDAHLAGHAFKYTEKRAALDMIAKYRAVLAQRSTMRLPSTAPWSKRLARASSASTGRRPEVG
jgi:hypothetical protein